MRQQLYKKTMYIQKILTKDKVIVLLRLWQTKQFGMVWKWLKVIAKQQYFSCFINHQRLYQSAVDLNHVTYCSYYFCSWSFILHQQLLNSLPLMSIFVNCLLLIYVFSHPFVTYLLTFHCISNKRWNKRILLTLKGFRTINTVEYECILMCIWIINLYEVWLSNFIMEKIKHC